jgi:hypothetical protein
MLKAKYPNILIWITCSLGFNGSRAYVRAGKHDLFQGTTSPLKGACDKKFLGVDCDFDEAEAIIRYDDRRPRGGWKQIHPAEAKLIRDAGLRLGIVYEDAAIASYFTRLEGILSATYARQQAAKRGQPDGSAEYFAVDFDPTSADVRNRIMPYLDGV